MIHQNVCFFFRASYCFGFFSKLRVVVDLFQFLCVGDPRFRPKPPKTLHMTDASLILTTKIFLKIFKTIKMV
jgi:hypothetical protein